MLMNIFDVSTIISWTLAVLAVVVTVLPQDVSLQCTFLRFGTPLASLVGVSDEAVIAVSVFWRLAYNLGLGALLRWQSKYNGMTKFLQVARRWPLAGCHRSHDLFVTPRAWIIIWSTGRVPALLQRVGVHDADRECRAKRCPWVLSRRVPLLLALIWRPWHILRAVDRKLRL